MKANKCDCCGGPIKPREFRCGYCGVYFKSEEFYQPHAIINGSGYLPCCTGKTVNLSGFYPMRTGEYEK